MVNKIDAVFLMNEERKLLLFLLQRQKVDKNVHNKCAMSPISQGITISTADKRKTKKEAFVL